MSSLQQAKIYVEQGWSIIPIGQNKTPSSRHLPKVDGKASWLPFRNIQATQEQIAKWYEMPGIGIGVVCGRVCDGSANLLVLDVEAKAAFDAFWELTRDEDPELHELLEQCARAITPSKDGRHIYLRLDHQPPAGTVLARDASGGVLIETRGEGHYVCAPGTPGRCHPTNKPYRWEKWLDNEDASLLKAAHVERILDLARSFNCPKAEEKPSGTIVRVEASGGDRINARDLDWEPLLEGAGWAKTSERDGVSRWRRPGKDHGISATLGHAKSAEGNRLFHAFSSNSAPFEQGKSYSLFAATALLGHAGDFSACARAELGTRAPVPVAQGASARPTETAQYQQFPTGLLPQCLGDFVRVVAKSVQCDEAFVALPALSAIATAIGTARRIRLKAGWSEPSIIWTGIVAESGSGKSPPFDACMEPLREWQDCDKGRTLTSDATPEVLTKILSENPKGIILARDELSGWFGSFGAYKKNGSGDVSTWLEMFGGRAHFTDRVVRGSVKVPRSSVSVSGTIQPKMLLACIKPEFRANGLLARFLLAAPPKRRRRWTDQGIPTDCKQTWRELIWCLRAIEGENELLLTPEAQSEWVQFYNNHNDVGQDLEGDDAAHWSKLEAYAARLALCLQLVAHAGEGASASHVELPQLKSACSIVEWFGRESARVYRHLDGGIEKNDEGALLAFIKRKGGTITVRELQRRYSPFRGASAAEVEKSLLMLATKKHGTMSIEGKSSVFKVTM